MTPPERFDSYGPTYDELARQERAAGLPPTLTSSTEPSPRMTELCACGADLKTPYERRSDQCSECKRLDERMHCVTCGVYVGMAYTDGRPTVCSDQCEKAYWDA